MYNEHHVDDKTIIFLIIYLMPIYSKNTHIHTHTHSTYISGNKNTHTFCVDKLQRTFDKNNMKTMPNKSKSSKMNSDGMHNSLFIKRQDEIFVNVCKS